NFLSIADFQIFPCVHRRKLMHSKCFGSSDRPTGTGHFKANHLGSWSIKFYFTWFQAVRSGGDPIFKSPFINWFLRPTGYHSGFWLDNTRSTNIHYIRNGGSGRGIDHYCFFSGKGPTSG